MNARKLLLLALLANGSQKQHTLTVKATFTSEISNNTVESLNDVQRRSHKNSEMNRRPGAGS